MATQTEEIIIDVKAKGADKATEQLDDVANATNKADKAGQQYEGTLSDMAGEVEIFGVSVNGMIGGFKNSVGAIRNSVKSLGTFKTALAATGVGLLIISLGSLSTWLANTQEGMDLVGDAMSAVGATVEVIVGRITRLGAAFKNLFSGNFKGALAETKEAFKGIGDEIKRNIDLQQNFLDIQRDIQLTNAQDAIDIANNNKNLSEQKTIIEDITKTNRQRVRAAVFANDLIKDNLAIQKDALEVEERNLEIKFNAANARKGVYELDREQQVALAGLEVRRIELETQANEQQIEFRTKLNELRNQEAARITELNEQRKREVGDLLTTESLAYDASADAFVKANKKKELSLKTLEKAEVTNAKVSVAIDADANDEKLGATTALANAIDQQTSDSTAFGKTAATAAAFLNMYTGITQALLAPTLALKIATIAFVTTTGLKAIGNILSTPIPKAEDGILVGPGHDTGGVLINAEGGEAVINKNSVAMFKQQLSDINVAGGGIPFMQRGGLVQPSNMSAFLNLEAALEASRPVLVLDDLHVEQARVAVSNDVATL